MRPSTEGARIEEIRRRANTFVFDKEKTEKLLKHLKKVHRTKVTSKYVVHDEESNAFDAFGYMALHIEHIHTYAQQNDIEVIT